MQGHDKILGQSASFRKALALAKRVAPSSANVFITGESGTGKELFAQYIHTESKRSGKFVAINCTAIPENLLESELFGHAKGSFTGAYIKKVGLFEEAEDGTLFLDEIGDLALSLQAKLLRVIQERKIKRVGENEFRSVNCRIVSATHKDLVLEVGENRFREDLFFRLNVIPISIPALRERPEDILPLAEAFLLKFSRANTRSATAFSAGAIEFIKKNQWLGNVRELENMVERAAILSMGATVEIENFMPLAITLMRRDEPVLFANNDKMFCVNCDDSLPSLEAITQKYIEFAMHRNSGARDKTAREIGIDRKTLYNRMRSESHDRT